MKYRLTSLAWMSIAAIILLVASIASAVAMEPATALPLFLLGMAAATAEVNTPERAGVVSAYPLAANTTIYAGTLVALDANGRAVPAADSDGLRVIGRAEETVINGATAGAVSVDVKTGVFLYGNSATDAVDANDLGKFCFVADDNTVSETGGSHKVKAGRVVAVETAGVWVDTSESRIVPSADTITAAADLGATKTAVLGILRAQGLVK